MNNTIFTGSAVALVTPFTQNGVDYETYAQLIDFQIQNGTSAIVVLGTTGEPSTMLEKEKYETIKFAIEYINKRVPVIVGTGCNCTNDTIERSLEAQRLGADALLVVSPYYNKCTQKGLYEHYRSIADAVSIPIIVYNVPGRTCVNILPATMAELAKHENIVAIKEASGNITQISEMCAVCEGKADVYSGDDGIVLPVLALGGKGVISVAANIVPAEMNQLCRAFFEGNLEESRRLQFELNPLVSALFCEVNPIPVKTALSLLGYRVGQLRLPLTPVSEKDKEYLVAEMQKFGLL